LLRSGGHACSKKDFKFIKLALIYKQFIFSKLLASFSHSIKIIHMGNSII
jgi:hypothetical protein